MQRPVPLLSLLLLALAYGVNLATPGRSADEPRAKVYSTRERTQNLPAVKRDLPLSEVRDRLLGSPSQRSRQILFRRYLEQWRYDDLPGVWIEFDCVKGQEPRVTAVYQTP